MARHLPERCLRQFGYVQNIPRPIPIVPVEGINKWVIFNVITCVSAITNHVVEIQFPGQCVDGDLCDTLLYHTLTSSHPLSM